MFEGSYVWRFFINFQSLNYWCFLYSENHARLWSRPKLGQRRWTNRSSPSKTKIYLVVYGTSFIFTQGERIKMWYLWTIFQTDLCLFRLINQSNFCLFYFWDKSLYQVKFHRKKLINTWNFLLFVSPYPFFTILYYSNTV